MISIIITALICGTAITLVLLQPTITIKHVSTTEISKSMVEYQQILNEATPQDIKDDEDPQDTIDNVVSAISNIFEGDDD